MENQLPGKRLNKYMADSGYCSRREADRLIDEGRVRLDGRVGALGDRVLPGMAVTVDGTTVLNIIFIQSGYNGAGLGSTVVKLTSGSVIKMRIERTGTTDPTVGGTTLTRLSVERVG